MEGGGLSYRSVPRIRGLSQTQELDRRRAFRRIDSTLRSRDLPISGIDLDCLGRSEGEYAQRMGRAVAGWRDAGSSEDRRKSKELLDYLRDAVANLREPVLGMGSSNLVDIYDKLVTGVAGILGDDYLERPFSQNAEQFLMVEPHMTTCCAVCNVSPLGERVRGMLVSSFISPDEGGTIIPFPKEYKPGKGREDMAERKPKKAGSLFPAVETEEGEGWATVMFLEDDLSKPVSGEDRAGIRKAKQMVTSSGLSEKQQRVFLDYLGKGEKGDKFAITQAESVVYGFFKGYIPHEQFEFEVRLMDAWLEGEIDSFLEKERKALNRIIMPAQEKTTLNKMFDLALTRSDILKAVTAGALRYYHPMQSPKERLEMVGKMAYILESAKPAREQQA